MDDSGLGSVESDFGDGQSNTGAAAVPTADSYLERFDNGLEQRPPGSWIQGFHDDQPNAGTSDEIQFSPDENEIIEVAYCPLGRYNLIHFADTDGMCNPGPGMCCASLNGIVIIICISTTQM